MKSFIFTIFGVLLLMPIVVFSQNIQSQPAKFKGVVVDANVARIPKATVVIEGKGKKWKFETDATGENVGGFNVELPAGSYKFTIEALGFRQLIVKDFCIGSGTTVSYEFKMKIRDCDDCDGFIIPDKPQSSH